MGLITGSSSSVYREVQRQAGSWPVGVPRTVEWRRALNVGRWVGGLLTRADHVLPRFWLGATSPAFLGFLSLSLFSISSLYPSLVGFFYFHVKYVLSPQDAPFFPWPQGLCRNRETAFFLKCPPVSTRVFTTATQTRAHAHTQTHTQTLTLFVVPPTQLSSSCLDIISPGKLLHPPEKFQVVLLAILFNSLSS